jgi:hypothetical protein
MPEVLEGIFYYIATPRVVEGGGGFESLSHHVYWPFWISANLDFGYNKISAILKLRL